MIFVHPRHKRPHLHLKNVLQVVRALGANAVCTAGSPAKRALLRKLGVQVRLTKQS